MQIAMTGVRIVGPATAGALVAAFGPIVCYVFDSFSFVVSASLIGSVAIMRTHAPAASTTPATNNRVAAVWHDLTAGLRFIIHHKALSFVVLAMAAGLFTIGCFGPLIAIFVREFLHASAGVFGIVSAMVGVGLLVGSQAIRSLARHSTNDMMVLSGLAGSA